VPVGAAAPAFVGVFLIDGAPGGELEVAGCADVVVAGVARGAVEAGCAWEYRVGADVASGAEG